MTTVDKGKGKELAIDPKKYAIDLYKGVMGEKQINYRDLIKTFDTFENNQKVFVVLTFAREYMNKTIDNYVKDSAKKGRIILVGQVTEDERITLKVIYDGQKTTAEGILKKIYAYINSNLFGFVSAYFKESVFDMIPKNMDMQIISDQMNVYIHLKLPRKDITLVAPNDAGLPLEPIPSPPNEQPSTEVEQPSTEIEQPLLDTSNIEGNTWIYTDDYGMIVLRYIIKNKINRNTEKEIFDRYDSLNETERHDSAIAFARNTLNTELTDYLLDPERSFVYAPWLEMEYMDDPIIELLFKVPRPYDMGPIVDAIRRFVVLILNELAFEKFYKDYTVVYYTTKNADAPGYTIPDEPNVVRYLVQFVVERKDTSGISTGVPDTVAVSDINDGDLLDDPPEESRPEAPRDSKVVDELAQVEQLSRQMRQKEVEQLNPQTFAPRDSKDVSELAQVEQLSRQMRQKEVEQLNPQTFANTAGASSSSNAETEKYDGLQYIKLLMQEGEIKTMSGKEVQSYLSNVSTKDDLLRLLERVNKFNINDMNYSDLVQLIKNNPYMIPIVKKLMEKKLSSAQSLDELVNAIKKLNDVGKLQRTVNLLNDTTNYITTATFPTTNRPKLSFQRMKL